MISTIFVFKMCIRDSPVTCGIDQVTCVLANGFAAMIDIPGLNYRTQRYKESYDQLPQNLILGSETASTAVSYTHLLCHSYILQVIIHIEWTENRPVMWNNNRLPFCVIKLRLASLFKISFTEFPVFLEQRLTALRLQCASGAHQKYS